MQVDDETLRSRYRAMEDEDLQEAWRPERLSHQAQRLLREELERRGLPLPAPQVEAEAAPAQPEEALFDPGMRLRPLARYLNSLEASIHCELLKSEGIAAVLSDQHTAVTDNLITYAMGGVGLHVPERQLAEARRILAETRAGLRTVSAADLADLPPVRRDRDMMTHREFLYAYTALVALSGVLTAVLLYTWG